jgi:hypothetical protein
MSLERWSLLVGLGAWAASVLAGVGVHAVRTEQLPRATREAFRIEDIGDVVRAGVWEARVALADFAWLEASRVFHRGVSDPEELHRKPTRLRPWVPEHAHDMDSLVEMMPWVKLTTTLNPHHSRAYVLGAHYLSAKLGQPAQALDYLSEGARNNPGDGLIELTAGRIQLIDRRAPAAAVPHLRRAVAADHGEGIEAEESQLESVRFLAHALRLTGEWEEGIALWREQAELHSDDPAYPAGLGFYLDLVEDASRRESFDHPDLQEQGDGLLDHARSAFDGGPVAVGEDDGHDRGHSDPDHVH